MVKKITVDRLADAFIIFETQGIEHEPDGITIEGIEALDNMIRVYVDKPIPNGEHVDGLKLTGMGWRYNDALKCYELKLGGDQFDVN